LAEEASTKNTGSDAQILTIAVRKSPKIIRKHSNILATNAERESFEMIQEAFAGPNFLVHYQTTRRLFVVLNASKKMGFEAVVFHVKGNPEDLEFSNADIEPILFLSKHLNKAEQNYWPTELEIAGLVWTVKKIRRLIESSCSPTVIFTDHSATPSIVKQTILTSSSVEKPNLRRVRASETGQ
jgi:hypothetical protein